MTLSIELLKSMDDAHAINALRADFDPLVNTPLEAFLIDWVESLVDDGEDEAAVADAADEYELDPDDIRQLGDALVDDVANTIALLSVLSEEGIETPDQLREALTNTLTTQE